MKEKVPLLKKEKKGRNVCFAGPDWAVSKACVSELALHIDDILESNDLSEMECFEILELSMLRAGARFGLTAKQFKAHQKVAYDEYKFDAPLDSER